MGTKAEGDFATATREEADERNKTEEIKIKDLSRFYYSYYPICIFASLTLIHITKLHPVNISTAATTWSGSSFIHVLTRLR